MEEGMGVLGKEVVVVGVLGIDRTGVLCLLSYVLALALLGPLGSSPSSPKSKFKSSSISSSIFTLLPLLMSTLSLFRVVL